jgi:hypothetical protein
MVTFAESADTHFGMVMMAPEAMIRALDICTEGTVFGRTP